VGAACDEPQTKNDDTSLPAVAKTVLIAARFLSVVDMLLMSAIHSAFADMPGVVTSAVMIAILSH